MDVSNKKVLITGGSSGIGKALIGELSKRGATDIAVMGRTGQKLDDLDGQFPSLQIMKLQGDVSQIKDIDNATAKIEKEWGEAGYPNKQCRCRERWTAG